MTNRNIRATTLAALVLLSVVAVPLGVVGASTDAGPSAERAVTQNDDLSQVITSINDNEIANANDSIASFNEQLQQKASLLSVDVENVDQVATVSAETAAEAQAEADRLRTAAGDREAAIFDRVVTVINEGGVADVDPNEVQSPADARAVSDRLEQQGGLATQAAQSLRDAADLVETDLEPNLTTAAEKLSAFEAEPSTGTVEGTVTDGNGGAVTNATVVVGDQQMTTADDGGYSLDIDPGEYTLAVSAAGYQDASEAVTVEAGATATVDVSLQAKDDGSGDDGTEDNESDTVADVVTSVNENEIANANDAITSFNEQLQQKANLLGVDVESVETVAEVEATTSSEGQSEANRLRTAADDREAAIFDRVVTVINEGGVADVDPNEVQSPADARAVADRLEQQGGLATQAAQSLRDAADLVETDLEPNLTTAAEKLAALDGNESEPAIGFIDGVITAANGEPIANATVSVGEQQTTTAADGSYGLELESGEYTVTVSAEGYRDASEEATVEANATTTVDVTLTEANDDGSTPGECPGPGPGPNDGSDIVSAIWNAVIDFGIEIAQIVITGAR
ncbi:carboxypeptidase regulatory-like domain-containing protein [Natrinema halophilum]|uniref:Carboxypeptidase regulatory-like domain-containing protein n=1 Tax=Natrinema halophilum TaxID=1699371 RepID=A0A7D5KPI4_9EURY|nr:carboxypeptidase regulatory-like domain-containing protein [Natrinema halophilum]QLG47397.1 carboxypeptidase regulatory-like domain-containing protein [Natrinema halophilum]